MAADLSRRVVAEALGTAMLVATVVGSGIMADRLTGDVAVSLLGNTLPTGAILVVLITILGPISGAHFNPAVTLVFALRREIEASAALAYVVAQIAGGVAGTLLAHAMFELPILQISQTVRTGNGQWLAELVAAFGLVFTILAGLRFRLDAIPWLVGLYITAAYWFTASTSFANPAVAIARAVSNTFAGIRPVDLPAFIVAEVLGALLAMALAGWLLSEPKPVRQMRAAKMTITIYHNPDCGTSRNTLAIIRQSGEEPDVIEYLKNPPSRERLVELIKARGMTLRELLREKDTPYAELNLGDPKWTDDEIVDFMLAHPILINRPIVVTPLGTMLARPSEAVLAILPNPNIGPFTKEDGEVVIDASGRRV